MPIDFHFAALARCLLVACAIAWHIDDPLGGGRTVVVGCTFSVAEGRSPRVYSRGSPRVRRDEEPCSLKVPGYPLQYWKEAWGSSPSTPGRIWLPKYLHISPTWHSNISLASLIFTTSPQHLSACLTTPAAHSIDLVRTHPVNLISHWSPLLHTYSSASHCELDPSQNGRHCTQEALGAPES